MATFSKNQQQPKTVAKTTTLTDTGTLIDQTKTLITIGTVSTDATTLLPDNTSVSSTVSDSPVTDQTDTIIPSTITQLPIMSTTTTNNLKDLSTDTAIASITALSTLIEQVPNTASAPVVIETTGKLVANTLESMIEQIKATGTIQAKNTIANLELYMKNMSPGIPLENKDGANYQLKLWKTILSLLEHSKEEDFRQSYGVLLGLFDKHKNDVFHERYVFRFMDSITIDKDESFAFLGILNLIKLTASFLGRKEALKQVDLGRTLGKVFSEQARQKVLAFYGL